MREPEYGERWDVFCAIPEHPLPNVILDVGCGTGHGFQTYRKQGVRLVGVDNHKPSVDEARKRLDEALVLDIESDRWPQEFTGAFDVVAFCDCLEHLVDPWKVLVSVIPLLSDHGVVVASIPNLRQWRNIAKLIFGRWDYVRGAGTVQRDHLRFFTRMTVIDMFTEAGYSAPRFFFPGKTFHLGHRLESAVNAATVGRVPDFLYGSYTVSAAPFRS